MLQKDIKSTNKLEVVKIDKIRFVNWHASKQLDLKNLEKPVAKMRSVNVVFGKGKKSLQAMKNISLNLYANEVLGLVGESGSGKTTTGRALAGIQKIDSGQITINDTVLPLNINKIKGQVKKNIINDIQMIFQDPTDSLNPQKSIYKVIAEGLDNIDIKSNFLRAFFKETIAHAQKIYSQKIQAYYDQTLLDDYIKNKQWNKALKYTYQQAIAEIKASKNAKKNLVLTYLKAKYQEAQTIAASNRKSVAIIKRKIIIDLLKIVGLDEQVLHRFPLEFSGGQQQRIGIVRSIAMRPKIIVADEPISALDVSIQAQVINILNDLKDKYHLSVLFIAHDLRMVEYISDRIAIMYRGEIVELGATSQVMKNPLHPYTKILLSSVPSIDKIHTDLSSENYQASHYYNGKETRAWFQVENKNHFIFAGKQELRNFQNFKMPPTKTLNNNRTAIKKRGQKKVIYE